MKTKPSLKKPATTPVPLHRIKVGSEFVYNSITYKKFAAKRGMDAKGGVVMLADNTLVTPMK